MSPTATQETELDRFQAPEEAAAEEDKLRAEREAKEKQQIKVSTAAAITKPSRQPCLQHPMLYPHLLLCF